MPRVNHRTRPQRYKCSESRARTWIDQKEKGILREVSSPSTTPSLGAFIVRRALLGSTTGGLYERKDILDFLEADHGAAAVGQLGTSLINPREAKELFDPWNGEGHRLQNKLEDVAAAMPEVVTGYLGRAIILGMVRNRPGVRYVGFDMSVSAQQALQAERAQLFFAADHPISRNRSHITLLETPDMQMAEDLTAQLNRLEPAGTPIELGPAQVVPIPNVACHRS